MSETRDDRWPGCHDFDGADAALSQMEEAVLSVFVRTGFMPLPTKHTPKQFALRDAVMRKFRALDLMDERSAPTDKARALSPSEAEGKPSEHEKE